MDKIIRSIVEEIAQLEKRAVAESRDDLWNEIDVLIVGLRYMCLSLKNEIKDIDGDAYYKEIKLPFDFVNLYL